MAKSKSSSKYPQLIKLIGIVVLLGAIGYGAYYVMNKPSPGNTAPGNTAPGNTPGNTPGKAPGGGNTGEGKAYNCPLPSGTATGECQANANCMYESKKCQNRVLSAAVDCDSITSEGACDNHPSRCEWTKGYKWYPGYPNIGKGNPGFCVKRPDTSIPWPQPDTPP
jgi:hypothetical protein